MFNGHTMSLVTDLAILGNQINNKDLITNSNKILLYFKKEINRNESNTSII